MLIWGNGYIKINKWEKEKFDLNNALGTGRL